MKIAVWNLPPAEAIASGFGSGERQEQFDVHRLNVEDCERVLREGHVDAALLPAVSILKQFEDFDVVPAVALSSWSYPFARLVLAGGLSNSEVRIAFDPSNEQERFVAQVVLKEHYKMRAEFVPVANASNEDLVGQDMDGALLVGPDVPLLSSEDPSLDLGQEWFELANYPMTWGLFAARKDELDAVMIRSIRDAVLESERQRGVWLRAKETSQVLHTFFREDLRFRLDDLCIAGLTELRQFLFYYDVVDGIRDIPFVFLPDDEDESDTPRKPIL